MADRGCKFGYISLLIALNNASGSLMQPSCVRKHMELVAPLRKRDTTSHRPELQLKRCEHLLHRRAANLGWPSCRDDYCSLTSRRPHSTKQPQAYRTRTDRRFCK